MLNKLIKIFILPYLFAVTPCFSQIKETTGKKDTLLTQYNTYLAALHLKQLIRATNFSNEKQVNYNGSLGNVQLNGVHVLTIDPDSTFNDPLAFEGVWTNTLSTFNQKGTIYSQLFFKLADFTGLPPDSLVIFIKTRKPNIIAYLVYFDKEIKINGPNIEMRVTSGTPADINADGLNNVLYGCVFQGVKYNEHIRNALIEKIRLFLTEDQYEKTYTSMNIPIIYRAPDVIFFERRNVTGRITKKYYEDITITLTFIPSAIKTKTKTLMDSIATVVYSLNVAYSGKRFSAPGNIENSENAISHYKDEMHIYGEKLYQLMSDIFISAKQ